MKNIVKYVLCVATLAGLWTVPAAAQNCSTLLAGINNWFITQPDGPYGVYYLRVSLVGNNAAGGYDSFAEGPHGQPALFSYTPAQKIGNNTYPPYVKGNLTTYFSDRRFDPSNSGATPWAPFNPNSVDSATAQIFLQGSAALGIKAGEIVMQNNTWGGTTTYQGVCANGLMTWSTQVPPTYVWTHFTMSLNEDFFPGQ